MRKYRGKNIIYLVVLLLTLGLTIGFSAFQNELFINDILLKVRLQKDVRVSESVISKSSGAVVNDQEYNKTKLLGNVTFDSTSSYVLYKVDLTNYGNVKSGLLNINSNTSGINYSICDSNGSNCTNDLETPICNGSNCTLGATKEVYVKVSPTASGTKNIDLDLDIQPYVNITYDNIRENTNNFKKEVLETSTYQITLTSKPEEVEVSGDVTASYNKTTGVLILSNIQSDLTIQGKYLINTIAETSYTGTNPDNYVRFNNSLFRIITKENIDDGYGNTELRTKITKNDSIGEYPFDEYDNFFEFASIYEILNDTYYNTLSNDSKELIESSKWALDEGYGSTSIATIGLINKNDFLNNSSWLTNEQYTLINADYNRVVCVISTGLIDSEINVSRPTYPTIYLKTNVLVVGGNGTESNPYILDLASNGLQPNPTVISKRTLTVTGSNQELVTVSNKVGTVFYSLETELNSSNYQSDGSTDIPVSSNAGGHAVYYYIPAINNYKAKQGFAYTYINPLTFRVTYQKGSNVSTIGKSNDSCTTTGSNLTCSVILPSISPNYAYESVGWSTINGDTTGTAEGQTYTVSSNVTLYANARVKRNYQNITTNTYYAFLNNAFSEVSDNQTIKVLVDVTETSNNISLPAGKIGIKLDLNGKTISSDYQITNNGELDIYNSSSTDGKIDVKESLGINNNGTLLLNGTSSTNKVILTALGGTGQTSCGTICNNESKSLIINENSEIISTDFSGIGNSGSAIINNGIINGRSRGINNRASGNLSINGDDTQIIGRVNDGISNYGILTIIGGTITGSTYGIDSHSSLTVTGGTITGTIAGVIFSSSDLVLGTNDSTVSTTSPVIESTGTSNNYGVNIGGGGARFYFYDGVIKSSSGSGYAISSTPTNIPTDYQVQKTVTNGVEAAILVPIDYKYINTSTNVRYETLNEAFSDVANNQTIRLLKDVTETTNVTLASGKTGIKLDLYEHVINLNGVTLTNNGSLDIYNSAGENIGYNEFNSTLDYGIINNGTLSINGTSSEIDTYIYTGIQNNSGKTLNIYENTYIDTTSPCLINNGGITNISGGYLSPSNSSTKGVCNSSTSSKLNMTGGRIDTQAIPVHNISGTLSDTVNISGGIINVNTSSGPITNSASGTITISGGQILGATLYPIVNTGTGSIVITGNTQLEGGIKNESTGIVTIGTNDSAVNIVEPIIDLTLATWGDNSNVIEAFLNPNGTMNFYDGTITIYDSADYNQLFHGNPVNLPTNYVFSADSAPNNKQLVYLKKLNILMGGTSGTATTNYLRTNIKRQDIESLTFANSLSEHTVNGTDCWDVSKDTDGTVLAWVTDSDSNSKYEMTIGTDGVIYASSGYYLFGNLTNLDSLNGMNNFDTSRVTNMSNMFSFTGYSSTSFTLDLGDKFDTSNVTNMSFMFYQTGNSSTVFTLDLGDKFDTSNVRNMYGMFTSAGYSSTSFTLDLGDKFDTSNVTNMSVMFSSTGYSSTSFTLDLGDKFDTSNVTDMANMFYYTGLNSIVFTLDLGDKFDTSNVTNMSEMFFGTGYSSTAFTLDLGDKFDTSNVTDMSSMFYSTGHSRTSFTLDLGDKFDTSNVTNMGAMFMNAGYNSQVFTLDLGDKFDTSNVTSMSSMFSSTGYSSTVFTLDLGDKFNTSNVTDMSYMFSKTGYSSTVFTLDLGDKFDTSNVTNMWSIFNSTGYSSPVFTLDLGDKFDTSNVTNMDSMFYSTGYNSTGFTIDLGNKFDTSKVIDMSNMFSNSRKMKTIYAPSSFVTTNVTISTNMFSICTSLLGGQGTAYNSSNPTDKTYAHIDGGTSNPGYFTAIGAPLPLVATFYYNSNTNSGSFTKSSVTAACVPSTTGGSCTVTVPSVVTSSVGKYNSAYKGVSNSTGNMNSSSLTISADTTYYANYSSDVTIYYPSSTTARSSTVYKRNEFFSSDSAMSSVLATSNTATTNFTFSSAVSGYSLYGFANSASTNTRNYSSVSALAQSDKTTSYAVLRVGKTATVYYNSGSGNGTLSVSTATTATAYQYLRCTSTAAEISNSNYTIPTSVSGSVGQYGNTYYGTASAVNSMTNARTTAYTTLYAIYRNNNVTNYYYGSSYTNRTLYRNNMFTSTTAMKSVLSTSGTGTSNYSTATGPGSSVWTGLSTGQDTTTEYSSIANAAASTATTLYTVYTFNVTYQKGSNVSAIGSTSGSCKVTTSSTSCNVTLPSITANSGAVSVGWSTTNGDTTGTAAGGSYSLSTNGRTLYGNAKLQNYWESLGHVTINATGDYAYNYYSNAEAFLGHIDGKQYLKVTGKWYSMGENVSGNVTAFPTNINVGPQTKQVTVVCQCFYNTTETTNLYTTYNGYVTTSGVLYLTLGHENRYRTFNQYDYSQTIIELSPAP